MEDPQYENVLPRDLVTNLVICDKKTTHLAIAKLVQPDAKARTLRNALHGGDKDLHNARCSGRIHRLQEFVQPYEIGARAGRPAQCHLSDCACA
jgi:hypothetical protein